jgi:hypothetical protein
MSFKVRHAASVETVLALAVREPLLLIILDIVLLAIDGGTFLD